MIRINRAIQRKIDEMRYSTTVYRSALPICHNSNVFQLNRDMFRVGPDTESRVRGIFRMESDFRYYARRVAQERDAARNAVTAEARLRRLELAAKFQEKLEQLGVPA